jgi:hypothetical protein
MSLDKSQDRFLAVELLSPFLGRRFLLHYFVHGLLAFVLFELCLSFLLRVLNLSRSRGFAFPEFLLFISVSGLTYSYTLWSQQNVRTQKALSQGLSRIQEHSKLRNSYRVLVRKLESISDGIAESLSAIMFFARAHLVGTENTQKARDLREIVERIDQVQLLLKEMQISVNGEFGKETFAELSQLNNSSSTNPTESVIKAAGSGETSPIEDEKSWLKPVSSLRKSARKVLILPVVVRFVQAENSLEFQTFTVNVCEEGACIILSSSFLSQEEVIDVQMPSEFAAQARLKWIQPVGTNLFRLGGIEFLGSKLKVTSV